MADRHLLFGRSCLDAGLELVRVNSPDYLTSPELGGAGPGRQDRVCAVVCVTTGPKSPPTTVTIRTGLLGPAIVGVSVWGRGDRRVGPLSRAAAGIRPLSRSRPDVGQGDLGPCARGDAEAWPINSGCSSGPGAGCGPLDPPAAPFQPGLTMFLNREGLYEGELYP